MMLRWLTALLLGMSRFCAYAAPNDGANFLTPHILVGEQFSNTFSIATSVSADGFEAAVRRYSGTADYVLKQPSANRDLLFDYIDLYDGSVSHRGEYIVRDGGATFCWQEDCKAYTDASGLLYNRFLWGYPPAHLKVGMTWNVAIAQQWELGPAGTQLVTVMQLNQRDGIVTLKREGTATGAFSNESSQVTLVKDGKRFAFDFTPGQAHWNGFTTFKHGIVLSDELLVVRHDELHSEETGTIKATTRRYTLLNAAPYPTL